MLTGYLAPEGLAHELKNELTKHRGLTLAGEYGDLFVVAGPAQKIIWAQNTLENLKSFDFESVTQAANHLKEQGGLWTPYSYQLHRRTELIQEKLKKIPSKRIAFLSAVPKAPLKTWFLESPNRLWCSETSSSPFPLGVMKFEEDKKFPPSRAYLKLWEFFTLHGVYPKRNEKCVDLGSSPGGWTWVLAELGTQVISVDKAPLAENVRKAKNVQSLQKDAFQLKPQEIGPVDWLFSDIICFPARLFELVEEWRSSGLVKNFVFTIKFKGETDFVSLEKFAAIPGSKIQHLAHNKHEVTWSLLQESKTND